MEDRETARMRKYWESKTTRIMVATVPHVTSGLGLRKFQADGFLLTRVYQLTAMYILYAVCIQTSVPILRDPMISLPVHVLTMSILCN